MLFVYITLHQLQSTADSGAGEESYNNKTSPDTVSVISVDTDVENIFIMYKNSSTPSINATLWQFLDTKHLDFRHDNNSTPEILIKEIRYVI